MGTIYYDSEYLSCLGPKIWDIITKEIKNASSLTR